MTGKFGDAGHFMGALCRVRIRPISVLSQLLAVGAASDSGGGGSEHEVM